jgi:hypothetical protein
VESPVDVDGSLLLYGGEWPSLRSMNKLLDMQNGIPAIINEVGRDCDAMWYSILSGFYILGLVALATAAYSTLLVIPGRQMGHVQLIHLPPCRESSPLGPPPSAPPKKPPPPPSKHPVSMIVAHDSALTTLSVPPSGRFVATTSSKGTLVRIWDAHSGNKVREFRRGTDKADIFGVAFRPDETEVCVWSDKGTVHVFNLMSSTSWVFLS